MLNRMKGLSYFYERPFILTLYGQKVVLNSSKINLPITVPISRIGAIEANGASLIAIRNILRSWRANTTNQDHFPVILPFPYNLCTARSYNHEKSDDYIINIG